MRELDAAALERALVDAGLDGAVGREETGALDAAGLERVASVMAIMCRTGMETDEATAS
ncbi:MAG: hypothetical protein ACLRSD_07480 [Oscillibacter sp.]